MYKRVIKGIPRYVFQNEEEFKKKINSIGFDLNEFKEKMNTKIGRNKRKDHAGNQVTPMHAGAGQDEEQEGADEERGGVETKPRQGPGPVRQFDHEHHEEIRLDEPHRPVLHGFNAQWVQQPRQDDLPGEDVA